MTDTITLTGLVATAPRHVTTSEGLPITSFRLASTQRRYIRATSTWVDGETNWYTVSTFRRLAVGAAASVFKGDRIIVTGRLRIRDWSSNEKSGMTIEVDADALGHDLTWGTASFTRNTTAAKLNGQQSESGDQAGTGGEPNSEDAVAAEADTSGFFPASTVWEASAEASPEASTETSTAQEVPTPF